MDNPDKSTEVLVLVYVVLFAFVGFFALGCWRGCTEGWKDGREEFRREAVEAGHAEHDSKTGEWRWKSP